MKDLDSNHCDAPRCRQPWEVNYLGRRLCQKHWLQTCGEEVPARRVRVRPAAYRAKITDDTFFTADWLPVDLPGVE